ncbi:hypothetical protein FOA52_010565 [Chlamydomonas sp. UWO 241]|nr:hypothetical protein FOA52_010565 [Chlamydomonas sp. UWO 241]
MHTPHAGTEPLHEAVRQRLLEARVVERVVSMLVSAGRASDDILWACLFCMAGLARHVPVPGGSPVPVATAPGSACKAALRDGLSLGLLPLLRECADAYTARAADSGAPPDELIHGAGVYLDDMLCLEEGAVRRAARARYAAAGLAVGGFVLVSAVAATWTGTWTGGGGGKPAKVGEGRAGGRE